MQKSDFLKAFSDMWKDFDSRVLRYKVLPPLCAELRNLVMQPIILPMVLTIAESQDKSDFEISSLPALVPVLNTASGFFYSDRLARSTLFHTYCPCLLELMMIPMPACKRKYSKRLSYLQNNWMFRSSRVFRSSVPPAVACSSRKFSTDGLNFSASFRAGEFTTDSRSCSCSVASISCTRAWTFTASPAPSTVKNQMVKQVVLPRVHGLALKTTVAAVRVNALLCFSDMVHIVDKKSVLDILQTIHQCTAVDHSSPTLMCTLGVANSILKQQLNVQQFAKYMLFVKDALRKIEETRGVTLTDAGVSEVRTLPAFEGRPSGQMNKSASNIPSIPKRSSSWDEDWLPARVAPTAIQYITTTSKTRPSVQSQPVQVNSRYSRSSTSSIASTQEPPSSCPAVDVEWPPQSLSGVTIQLGDIEKLDVNKGASPNSTLDTIDPFANWPPRPSGTSSVLSSLNNGTTASTANNYGLSNSATTNGLSIQSASWASSLQSSSEFERQNQGSSKPAHVGNVSGGGPSSQNSLGFMMQNNGISAIGSSSERAADLGSIFAVNKNEKAAPRLAPPPAAAVGKVRGRGRGSEWQVGSSSQMKFQQPLLDLL